MKKFLFSAALLASAALTAPASAAVFIGLQQAGVNGGAITQVATGVSFAEFSGTYGTFEVNASSATDGPAPDVLDGLAHNTNTSGTGGVISFYITRTNIMGPDKALKSAFTANNFTGGAKATITSFYSTSNQLWGGTQLSTKSFTAGGFFEEEKMIPQIAGLYSVTTVYTVTAPDIISPTGARGGSRLTGVITAVPVPEPSTWAMMIGGFGLLGAASRRSVRAKSVLA